MAQLQIRRNAGAFGKLSLLDVVVDSQKVATLREGEQQLLRDLEEGATVHVEMHGQVRSPKIQVSGMSTDFECGSNRWLLLDWLDLCYLPGLREHVFYLRPLAKSR